MLIGTIIIFLAVLSALVLGHELVFYLLKWVGGFFYEFMSFFPLVNDENRAKSSAMLWIPSLR